MFAAKYYFDGSSELKKKKKKKKKYQNGNQNARCFWQVAKGVRKNQISKREEYRNVESNRDKKVITFYVAFYRKLFRTPSARRIS